MEEAKAPAPPSDVSEMSESTDAPGETPLHIPELEADSTPQLLGDLRSVEQRVERLERTLGLDEAESEVEIAGITKGLTRNLGQIQGFLEGLEKAQHCQFRQLAEKCKCDDRRSGRGDFSRASARGVITRRPQR